MSGDYWALRIALEKKINIETVRIAKSSFQNEFSQSTLFSVLFFCQKFEARSLMESKKDE